mgnify:CR=1 FL=1
MPVRGSRNANDTQRDGRWAGTRAGGLARLSPPIGRLFDQRGRVFCEGPPGGTLFFAGEATDAVGARACPDGEGCLVRLAADRARVGSDSPKETGLRLALVDAGLPEPAVNRWILDPRTGGRVHRGDLTYEEYRLTLEYECRHHSDPDQVARDIDRQERLEVRHSKALGPLPYMWDRNPWHLAHASTI